MPPLFIALVIILVIHYFLAIATVYLVLKDMGLVKAVIPWNLIVLLITLLGPAAYLIFRCFRKKK